MSRILLTGGAGFLGAHLAAALLERGDQVRVLDTMDRDALNLLGLEPHVELIVGSVVNDEMVSACTEGCDAVVHLASVAGVPTVLARPAKTMQVTLAGTLNVLEAARRFDVRRVVNISTSEVYGPYAYRADENSVTTMPPVGESPRWSYATAKLAAEKLCDSYGHEHHLAIVNVRPCNVYGPAQIGDGAVNNMMRAAVRGDDLMVHGDGTQIRSWCHVEDFTRALLIALDREEAVGEVLNVGNPEAVLTVRELAERIVRISGSRSRVVSRGQSYPDVEIRVLSVEKMRRLFGWTPLVALEDGLRALCEWEAVNARARSVAA